MGTTTRKRWHRRLDRAVRFLLAAAMVLQISAGSIVAYAADAVTPGETGTDTTQGAFSEFSEPLGSGNGNVTPDNEPGGPVDDDPANKPPADGSPADGDPTNEPPANDGPADDDPANELPADGGPTDDDPANEPPANDGPADDDPANEPPADDGPADDDPANEPPADDGPADDDPANEPPMDGGQENNDPVTDPEAPEDEPEEPVNGPARAPVYLPQAQADGDNLLTNPTFGTDGNDGTGWEMYAGTLSNGTITFNSSAAVDSAGNRWQQSVIQRNVTGMDPKYEYIISADISTTENRKMEFGFENADMTTVQLTAGAPQTVTYTLKGRDGSFTLIFFVGLEAGDFPGEHTVTISNISLVKGDEIPVPGKDTEDGEAPAVQQEGNLLTDGDFAAGSNAAWPTDNFLSNNGADVYFNKYRTVFYFTAGAANYQQGLKQTLTFENNKVYDVTVVVESDARRTISMNLHDVTGKGGDYYVSDPIEPNQPTTLRFATDGFGHDPGAFWLYLGLANSGNAADQQVTYPHKVVIYGISIVERPLDDTESDLPYDDIGSIKGVSPSDAFALPDGSWSSGTEHGAQAEVEQSEDGSVTVNITNSGSELADVYFGKRIDLKAGLEYTLSFDVVSDKDRSFNVLIGQIRDTDGRNGYTRPIAVKAGVKRTVTLQIPVQDQNFSDILFRFHLGRYVGESGNNATGITFSNIKLEVNGYREKAELINDGDFMSGFGSFMPQAASGTTITVRNRSVVAKIAGGLAPVSTFAMPRAGGSTLTRSVSGLESGAQYEVSFVAGAVKPCTLSVSMPDGKTQEYRLTGEAKPFSYSFTANQTAGSLVFDFGTEQNTICLDTVRLDVQGYAKAAGIDTAANDISELTSQEPPVITEMALATFGKTVTLRFPHINGEYRNSITGITIGDKSLKKGSGVGTDGNVQGGDYFISERQTGNWYYIYLNKDLFTAPANSDRATYDIVVSADYYADNVARQIVYKPNVFQADMTFYDDFMEALDMSKWGYQEGNGTDYGLWGWGNNEQQWYTRENVTVEDGVLKITATPGLHEGSPYNSGRIWTKVNGNGGAGFSQTYGRFEAKIKLPAGEGYQGLWPAFWLLPAEGADYYGGWPVSGEIDIMEARGREGDRMDGTLHFGSPGNDSPIGDHYYWDDPLAITDYHIYSVDWTPTYISFQVDGDEYIRYESWWSRADGEPQDYAYPAPFDRPFYIILNMAVGGEYDGYRNPDMSVLPADMLVDYVRVYQYANLNLSEIVKAPEIAKETIPADAKTSIADPAFNQVNKAILDGGYNRDDRNGWYLLTLDSFGGQANSSKTVNGGTTFLKVDVTEAGSAAHAVQLIQHLELYQGNWYQLSFDAYADQGRNITAKIAADGADGNWSSYNEAVAALGTAPQHYEYTFQMRSPTNLHSRLEINMGGAAGPVYVGNVTFQALDGPSFDNDVAKTPLESGEGIYNGRFDLGTVDRLNYWNAVGGKVVKELVDGNYEYRFKADSSNAALTQRGI